MTLQAKLGIAALTLGSGGVATYAALVPKVRGTEIRKLIEDEFKYLLLDTKDGDTNENTKEWGEKWSSYYEDNKNNTTDIFGLNGWTKGQNKELKDELRKKCKDLAKEEVQKREDKLYKDVIKYCSRDVNIKDQANKEMLSLIDVNSKTDEEWTKIAAKKDTLNKDFKNLGINAHTAGNYRAEDVKKGCKDVINKHKGQEDFQTAYNSYKNVCVKQEEQN